MNIEHIALYVNDLEAAKNFFTEYFGAKSNDGYRNLTTGFRSYFLSCYRKQSNRDYRLKI